MTKKLKHQIGDGVELRLDINENTVKTFTVPEGHVLQVEAEEVAIFDPNTRIQVYAGGNLKLDYTVPVGYRVVIRTNLKELQF